METIELAYSNLTIAELIESTEQDTLILRKSDGIILRKSDGTEFVLSAVDDFSAEVEALSQNYKFVDFLAQCSQPTNRVSSEEAQKRLGVS